MEKQEVLGKKKPCINIRCSTTPEKSPLAYFGKTKCRHTLPLPPPPLPPVMLNMWPPPYLKFKVQTPMRSIVLISKFLRADAVTFFSSERGKKRNSCAFKLALHHTWNLSQDICFHSQLSVFLQCILMASRVHFEQLLLLLLLLLLHIFLKHLFSRSADSLISDARPSFVSTFSFMSAVNCDLFGGQSPALI